MRWTYIVFLISIKTVPSERLRHETLVMNQDFPKKVEKLLKFVKYEYVKMRSKDILDNKHTKVSLIGINSFVSWIIRKCKIKEGCTLHIHRLHRFCSLCDQEISTQTVDETEGCSSFSVELAVEFATQF